MQIAPQPESDDYYAQFFATLVAHLQAKGWRECYLQHLADEPIAVNIASCRAMAGLARKYASGLRIVEACHTKDLVGAIDVWVPQLNFLHQDFDRYDTDVGRFRAARRELLQLAGQLRKGSSR